MTYVPTESLRVAVSSTGTFAFAHEPTRVTIVDVSGPHPAVTATLELSAGADCDVAWLGESVLVIERFAARAMLRSFDATGAVLANRAEAPVRMRATAGDVVLVSAGESLGVIDRALALQRFPKRIAPVAAGAMANHCFVVATSDGIEEWDPTTQARTRRWEPPRRAAEVTALGATSSSLWLTASDEPRWIDVIPLVARGQPTRHELPEPIARVSGHPSSDLVICRGAESRRAYAVDLDGHMPVLPLEVAEAAELVVGAPPRVLFAEPGLPLAMLTIHREAIRSAEVSQLSWRDVIATWTRGGVTELMPVTPAIEAIARRAGIDDDLLPAVVMCYGAYLIGEPGVPRSAIADILGGRWQEALGRGQLAARGVLRFDAVRITLTPELLRDLDALP